MSTEEYSDADIAHTLLDMANGVSQDDADILVDAAQRLQNDTIWVGAVYDGGNDDLFFYAASTEEKLLERLAAYAMEWAKVELDEEEYERFLHLITVEDYSSAIQIYFEEHSLEEWALYDEVRIGLQEWEETNLEDAEDLLEEIGARKE